MKQNKVVRRKQAQSWQDYKCLGGMDYIGTGNGLTTKGLTGIKVCDIIKQGNTRMNGIEESSQTKIGLDLAGLQYGEIGQLFLASKSLLNPFLS